MKIAIHCPRASYYVGGTERYVLNLFSYLKGRGHDVKLVTSDFPKSKMFLKFFNGNKGNIIFLNSNKLKSNFSIFKKAHTPTVWDKESRLFSSLARKLYNTQQFDIILFNYAVDCFCCPVDRKCLLFLHGLPDKKRNIENLALSIPAGIIALSKYIADGWRKLHGIETNIKICRNAICPSFYNKYARCKKKSKDILYFGRLTKIKNVEVIIKSVALLRSSLKSINLTIIGDGPEKNKLKKLAKKIGLKRNVHFLGQISDRTLFKKVACSRMAIFPSISREGIMNTILEAGIFGLAVFVADSCSSREIIEDNANGILFRPKDSQDLSKKILDVIQNKQIEHLGRNLKEEILSNWTWHKRIIELENYFNTFVDSKQVGGS